MEFKMYLDKVTKGALRYKDEDGTHTFYLRKDEVEGQPKKIVIVVKVEEE